MQSLGPDFKNSSSSRFQISVTAMILPGRNWTIETHSFNCFACRSSNQMVCQNFCGPFPISLLRMLGLSVCFVDFFLSSTYHNLKADMDACVCVYTHIKVSV